MATSKFTSETDNIPDEELTGDLPPMVVPPAGTAPAPPPPGPPGPTGPASPVTLQRTQIDPTSDQSLWVLIRYACQSIAWEPYAYFMDHVMRGHINDEKQRQINEKRNNLPFPGVDAYALLKAGTEVFLMASCGINPSTTALGKGLTVPGPSTGSKPSRTDALGAMATYDDEGFQRLNQTMNNSDLEQLWQQYLGTNMTKGAILPYFEVIRQKLNLPLDRKKGFDGEPDFAADGLLKERLTRPCMLELIWSYWHEEAMLAQTMNALSFRFQNRRNGSRDPLANLEIDPLRPLNGFLWGWIQDEQHRLSVMRRAYEYDHHYGFSLHGKAIQPVRGADSRSKFLEAFHNLLFQCMKFYNEDDDTTRIADGFAVLNSIREVHILLTEGGHNQYGDLPWNARMEMLMSQWILARPEMREFIGGRIMVAYPEPWMDRVDTMKTLQGWTNTNVMHFRDLGVFGEQIVLSVRFGNWNSVIQPQQAANWARYWRAEIQGYIHAYRAATGVDLTAMPTDGRMSGARFLPPSHHLRARLAEQQQRGRALPR
jgi:hypothetical protein